MAADRRAVGAARQACGTRRDERRGDNRSGGLAILVRAATMGRPDNAADDFRVPRGFTEVARPRQGSGFCWVTCTNGGEAVVTIVLETDYTDPTEACRALRPAIVDLTGDAVDASYLVRG